ncbi:MAG: flagellar biosynthesis protein FlhA [Myxococcota bacterium]
MAEGAPSSGEPRKTTKKRWYEPFVEKEAVMVLAGVGLILIVVAPLPALLMDLFLAISFAISLLVLLVTLYVRKPVDFSAFPVVLLSTTLYRLSLNVATTRLILLNGGEGDGQAGKIIQTFGELVVGNNPVVGIVVFIILVTINFVVITKGAGRVAEVAARFTLDAMPGKQMAVDAELNSGLINEDQAKKRRKAIAKEADFYGAMDGASKFIRGDALAGIIITVVNILGGILIGMVQVGLSFSDALQTYTVLTIGDGLVGQLPALIVSGAAGLLITRVSPEDEAEELANQLQNQMFGDIQPLAFLAASLFVFAFIPGLTFPFLLVAVVAMALVFRLYKKEEEEQKEAKQEAIRLADEAVDEVQNQEPFIDSMLVIEPLLLELGVDLVGLVDEKKGGKLVQSIQRIRAQIAEELGLLVPPVHVRDNLNIDGGEYIFHLRGEEIGRYRVVPRQVMALVTDEARREIRGMETMEPAFNLPALWIPEKQRMRAQSLGYTVVDVGQVISTHITSMLYRHAGELFSRAQLQSYLERATEKAPQLVDDIIPGLLSRQVVFRVLRNLLSEGVSIRDSQTILESLAEVGNRIKDPEALTEMVRQGLRRHITRRHMDEDGVIHFITFAPELKEQLMRALSITEGGGISFSLKPDLEDSISKMVLEAYEKLDSFEPVIMCPPYVRGKIRKLLRRQLKEPPPCVTDLELDQDYVEVLKMVALISTTGIQYHNMS